MGCRPSSRCATRAVGLSEGPRPERNQALPSGFHQRYGLTRKLGQGNFATVCSISDALKEFSEQELVVKIVDLGSREIIRSGDSPSKETGQSPNKEKELWLKSVVNKEVEMLRKVSKIKNCVRFVDVFLERDFGYIVMERCSMTFYRMLRSNADLCERSLIPIARDMFAGLSAIQSLGIIHRDIKPDNYMFSKSDNTVKLCDFGLSSCVTAARPLVKGIRGTAPFMSPEMLSGNPYGLPTDMWSVGVIMYAILLGEFPYMPPRPNEALMKELIRAGIKEPSFRTAPAPGSLNSTHPSCVSIDLLHSLIDRDPSTRMSADGVSSHAWFQVSSTSGHSTHPLRSLIKSAARAGAFISPKEDNRDRPLGGIDPILIRLQEASKASRISSAAVQKSQHTSTQVGGVNLKEEFS